MTESSTPNRSPAVRRGTRGYAGRIAAIGLVVVGFLLARPNKPEPDQLTAVAGRFQFSRVSLVELPDHPPYQSVRKVHPSLERISAWVSSVGAAATLADLDGDGLANDLVLVDPRTDQVSIQPVPGTGDRYQPFALDQAPWSQPSYDRATLAPTGTLSGDFNEDGQIDLLVYFWGRTPLLYLRKAGEPRVGKLSNESFTIQELVGSGERWFTDAATQADFDGDGHTDLLIANYFQDGSRVLDPSATGVQVMHQGKAKALNGGHKHLFLKQPAATASRSTPPLLFAEVHQVFSEEVARGWTVAVGAADLDGDLLPEIYLANDFGPDRLLHNRSTPGHVQFTLVEGQRDWWTPKSCVLGRDSFKGMGVDFGDVNGDGLPDIYVSNIATRFGLTESHFLWLSTGRTSDWQAGIAPFIHGSEKLGLSRSGFGWDVRLADFDNDGLLEAIQACGFIRGSINRWPELQALGTSNNQIVHNPRFWPSFRPGTDLSGRDANAFFARDAAGHFWNIAGPLGLADPMVTRGLAVADVDGDGRLDFVCANQWGPSYLMKNNGQGSGAFLGLRLKRGAGSPVIGAQAKVRLPDGRVLVGQVDGGNGHSGRRSPELHFGLGTFSSPTKVPTDLRWRDENGKIREQTVTLAPGWHTLWLGTGGAVERPMEGQAAK